MPARSPLRPCALLLALILAGCASDGPPVGAPPRQAGELVPKDEPVKPWSYRPYEVNGVWYTPLKSARGYREKGIASWYGTKFHGRLTSSREPYDMYAMSAAHKTLPLPSYVRVTNLKNGQSTILRVNDRGPFHDGRVIDLSYAAAHKLGIAATGTGIVEVEGIIASEYSPLDRPGQELADAGRRLDPAQLPPPPEPAYHPPLIKAGPYAAGHGPAQSRQRIAGAAPTAGNTGQIFVQIGAFAARATAEALARNLERDYDVLTAITPTRSASGLTLHRVRLGPVSDVDEADALMARLAQANLGRPVLVVE
ncbi:MAG: septal ring lytic transglycosylase RlpA family protein [Gammaproteobacteria bacterium]|nr:septal ring lytic transglycosylase RlpA family protein [Gammaproteobacteria bacterium]